MAQAEERVAQIEALRKEKARQAKEEKDRRSAAALAAKALAAGKKEAKLLEFEKKRMEAEERRELFAQMQKTKRNQAELDKLLLERRREESRESIKQEKSKQTAMREAKKQKMREHQEDLE